MAFAEDLRREAAEPEAHGHGDCANCETPLVGAWCHGCGQKGHLHNRLSHLLEELVEGIAHFDGRLWRTLPVLAFDPGRLSREWRTGKRVRYVAPLHVFLFSVFLFFLVSGLTGGLKADATVKVGDRPAAAASPLATSREVAEAISDTPVAPAEAKIADAIEKFADAKSSKYYQYKIKSLLYKLSFLLVPLSMAVLWIGLIGRGGFTLYDHATVSLYGLGFLALVATLTTPLRGPVSDVADGLLLPAMTAHAVVHLKGAYGLGWPEAIGRGLVVGLLTGLALIAFVVGVVAFGLAG